MKTYDVTLIVSGARRLRVPGIEARDVWEAIQKAHRAAWQEKVEPLYVAALVIRGAE